MSSSPAFPTYHTFLLWQVLEKEYMDVQQALLKGQDSSNGGLRAGRRRSSANMIGASAAPLSDHEEVHSRISTIEETLRM